MGLRLARWSRFSGVGYGTLFHSRHVCWEIGDKSRSWNKRKLQLTFNRSVIVAEVELVNSALSRYVLDRHGSVLVGLDGRLWASCGRHHDRLTGRNGRRFVSAGRPVPVQHTQQTDGNTYWCGVSPDSNVFFCVDKLSSIGLLHALWHCQRRCRAYSSHTASYAPRYSPCRCFFLVSRLHVSIPMILKSFLRFCYIYNSVHKTTCSKPHFIYNMRMFDDDDVAIMISSKWSLQKLGYQ